MVEPAKGLHRFFQRILARMTEGRMANIVGQAQGLGQILIQAQRAGDRGVIFGLFKKLHPCNITRNLYLIEYAYLYLYIRPNPILKSNPNLYENLYDNLIFRQKNKA